MGWCSATQIFDNVAEALLSDDEIDVKQTLKDLAQTLRYMDWDCEGESEYWEHPVVREIFKELDPDLFDNDED